MTQALSKGRIIGLLHLLNDRLCSAGEKGEVHLVGGAVMCLVLNARDSTQDLDALFLPSATLRAHVRVIAQAEGLPDDWLNDAAKGYLSPTAEWDPFLELSNLKIQSAHPPYLLAMKCLAMRLGAEFHDLGDVRFLLRALNINSYDQAIEILAAYYPLERFPQKTLYVLQELLEEAK